MQSFIRVVELWVPSPDGSLLEFGSSLYRAAPSFGALSRRMCFGRGEGLPGRAWEEGRPILLARFEGSYFMRTPAAQAAGLRCAVAVPYFVGDKVAAVLVLLCGSDEARTGAIELWHNDPRVTSDMTLVDGWFGAEGEELAALSRDAYLPRGVGLPGTAWQRGEAVFMPDLAAPATDFLRAESAVAAGLQQGLAVPCDARGSETCVVTVLAANSAPVARGIERWVAHEPAGQAGSPQCAFRHYQDEAAAPTSATLLPALGEAFASGIPTLVEAPSATAGALALLPVISEGRTSEVLVLVL
jgi:hypothetical protein